MNLYKLAKDLNSFIEECQEEAKNYPEIGGHIDALDRFDIDPFVLKEESPHYLEHKNNRIDIFKTTKGRIVYAAYSDKAAASSDKVQNSHYALKCLLEDTLEEGEHLDYESRWCGFYSWGTGNSTSVLMFWGESSDYPFTWQSENVMNEAVKTFFANKISPDFIVWISSSDHAEFYSKKSNNQNPYPF